MSETWFGRIPVILDVAAQVGLDTDKLLSALMEHRYEDRLKKGRADGDLYDVRVLPTFVFNEKEKIVGMRPIETFRELMKSLSCQ